ncbi:hypothetical protein D3C81_1128190 [compost metagenome]
MTVGDDSGKRLVDLVSDGGGELTHGRHPCYADKLVLRGRQLILCPFALSDVFNDLQEHRGSALGAGNQRYPRICPDDAAIPALVAPLHVVPTELAGYQLGDARAGGLTVILGSDLGQGDSAQVLFRIPEHVLEGGVRGQYPSILIGQRNTGRRVLIDCPPQLLGLLLCLEALLQRLFVGNQLLRELRQVLVLARELLLQRIPRALHHDQVANPGSQFMRGKRFGDVVLDRLGKQLQA